MAALSEDQLRQLCEALGWQGGTFWQVLQEVKRLKSVTASPNVQSARAMMEQRYTESGARAPRGASNPFREGSAAAAWWQRGNDGVGVPHGAPGSTDAERAAWLADKIVAHGDYAKEAATMLRRWPTSGVGVPQGDKNG